MPALVLVPTIVCTSGGDSHSSNGGDLVLVEVAVAEVEVGTPIPVYVLEEQKNHA